jgi:hypothetical protein
VQVNDHNIRVGVRCAGTQPQKESKNDNFHTFEKTGCSKYVDSEKKTLRGRKLSNESKLQKADSKADFQRWYKVSDDDTRKG